jgi:hypothetical protein
VRLYLELMFAFGSSFDTDPQLPWAGLILRDSAADQMLRAERLYQAVEEYHDEVVGPENRYAVAALERLVKIPFTAEAIPPPGDHETIARLLQSTYPQKVAYVGAHICGRLVQSAAVAAGGLRLPPPAGTLLIAGLMFGFGHGILEDPLYPWVRHGIEDREFGNEEKRIARLAARVRTYVSAMLTRFGRDA